MNLHEEQRLQAIDTIISVLKEMRPRPNDLVLVLHCSPEAAEKLCNFKFGSFDRKWLIQRAKLLKKSVEK